MRIGHEVKNDQGLRILLFGGAPTRDGAPSRWLGHLWHMRLDNGTITRPRHEPLPRIDLQSLEQVVRDANEYDLVFCETELALILVREWKRHGLPQRPILALEVDALAPLHAIRGWYRAIHQEDPWELLRDAPWVSWIAATPTQRDLLLAEGVPAGHITSLSPASSLFRCLWGDSPAHFEAAAAGNYAPTDCAGTVLFPGTGRRDFWTTLRTVMALPDLPFVVLGGERKELVRILGKLGKPWPENLRHIEQVPLPDFIDRVADSRMCVIPLRPGLGDGGHTTAIIAYRVGTPVICTDSPGLAGIHDGKDTVTLVQPEDVKGLSEAIRQLWSDEELRTRRIEAAKQFERFLDTRLEPSMASAIDRAVAHVPRH